jgi:hypothetical protein
MVAMINYGETCIGLVVVGEDTRPWRKRKWNADSYDDKL